MAPPVKTYRRTKKKNHNFVVKVRLPETSTRRRHQRMQKRAKTEQNLKLCDFPADLVANILGGLSSADRIRFGATCKNNLSLVTATTTTQHHRHQYQFRAIDKLPWLADFISQCPKMTSLAMEFSLFDPLHIQGQPNYATYQINDRKGEGFGRWDYTAVKASKKGWLLCLWAKQVQGKETGLTSFLLFSPFNKRIIKLPHLDHSFIENWHDLLSCHATFSSDPSSPGCVYFFLSQYPITGKLRISKLDHQGSKQWKTIVFDRLIKFVSSVVYHEGCFYCISQKCQLAAYDVVQQSWKLIIRSCPLPNLDMFSVDKYVLVCEGKVILVVLDRKPLEYKAEMNSCCLFEFSSSSRTWVKKTTLGNHALFVGDTSFSVPVSSSSSPDNIADRVYFYSSSKYQLSLFYYSLKDGHCHLSKDSGYWSSDVRRAIWIEPPSCLTGSSSRLA